MRPDRGSQPLAQKAACWPVGIPNRVERKVSQKVFGACFAEVCWSNDVVAVGEARKSTRYLPKLPSKLLSTYGPYLPSLVPR